MTLREFQKTAREFQKTEKLPVLFVGHGSPMNAVERNEYSRAWGELGGKLPKPKAVLCVSAHWLTEGTGVHIAKKPKTIHDFWGFPEELYNIQYPCPGAPEYAKETQALIKKTNVEPDEEWGLDHGTWVVMMHLFPKADVPVFQLSIDFPKPGAFHYELGRELAALRERGVLIVGSGNIVHNLGRIAFDPNAKPFDWALEFDELSKNFLEKGDDTSLIAYEKLGPAAKLAIPTPDHYFPLLYALGARRKGEHVSFPVTGIAHGSVSMRAVMFRE